MVKISWFTVIIEEIHMRAYPNLLNIQINVLFQHAFKLSIAALLIKHHAVYYTDIVQ